MESESESEYYEEESEEIEIIKDDKFSRKRRLVTEADVKDKDEVDYLNKKVQKLFNIPLKKSLKEKIANINRA